VFIESSGERPVSCCASRAPLLVILTQFQKFNVRRDVRFPRSTSAASVRVSHPTSSDVSEGNCPLDKASKPLSLNLAQPVNFRVSKKGSSCS